MQDMRRIELRWDPDKARGAWPLPVNGNCKTGTAAALRLINQQFSPYLARAKMGSAGNATVRRLYGTATQQEESWG